MKHHILLLATLLLLAVAGDAAAQTTAPARASMPALFAEPPRAVTLPPSGGALGGLIALLKPRVDRHARLERDKETWARFSRVGIPDKSAETEYMLRGILMTAVLSAGVVGWRLADGSPRGPRVAVKACRAGAMIGIQGEF